MNNLVTDSPAIQPKNAQKAKTEKPKSDGSEYNPSLFCAQVTDSDGLQGFDWRRFWLVSKPTKTRHYPSLVTNCDFDAGLAFDPAITKARAFQKFHAGAIDTMQLNYILEAANEKMKAEGLCNAA